MDCMYLALYIIAHTNSLQDALFMSTNFGGDSDSYGAVVGQIGGAIYGMTPNLIELYHQAPIQFDKYHTPYLAYLLHHNLVTNSKELYQIQPLL
jgi:ADP-ribosylglycohydrolase